MLPIDENLSYKLAARCQDIFPGICCVSKIPELGEGTPDNTVWAYAKTNNMAILTKDKDFIDYWQQFGPPPKVIRLDTGNCRLSILETIIRNNHIKILQFLNNSNNGLLVI